MSQDVTPTADPAAGAAPRGLGTFAGVFTPSILTILGIILFLRLGFIVGTGGLWQTLAVILLANGLSILTSFSLAAIATNFVVRGGGDYYLISRSLGREFGGALGIVLFLAQSVSIAFYAIGFAEGLLATFEIAWLSERALAAAALLPLFALAWLGADWAARVQYVVMAILAAALASFFIGAVGAFDGDILARSGTGSDSVSFWALFALFFPAVTGFTQGVSMSGDLRDPARSLPVGTFAAVALSMVLYLAMTVLFAGALPTADLRAGYDAMNRIAVLPGLVLAGVVAATLSSALASSLGAPRILQALAADRLFGFLNRFAVGVGPADNPRRAVLLSFGLAGITVALGDLNMVAPVVSMFFLISYGLLNYATYFEASSGSPSFRPRFRWYHRRLSLLGTLACAGTMIAIDPTAGAVAIATLVAIHQYLRHSAGPARWADANRSALFGRIRSSLLAMDDSVEHDRDWRPVSMVFSDDPQRRERIVRFATWIEGGAGLTTAVRVIEGSGTRARKECEQAETDMAADLRERGLTAFARAVLMEDIPVGSPVLLRAAGLGPIRPNMAIFNWFDREETAEDAPSMRAYGNYLRVALRNGCSVVVLAAEREPFLRLVDEDDGPRVIDVWWRADASSRLALLLAYLMSRRKPWNRARLRLLTRADPARPQDEHLRALGAELDAMRIRADPVLVPDMNWDALRAHSAGTSLAFTTFRVRPEGLCDADGVPLASSLEGLPPLALVLATRDIDLDAQPDEGTLADEARERDALDAAAAKAESLRAAAADEGAPPVAGANEGPDATNAPHGPDPSDAAGGTRTGAVH